MGHIPNKLSDKNIIQTSLQFDISARVTQKDEASQRCTAHWLLTTHGWKWVLNCQVKEVTQQLSVSHLSVSRQCVCREGLTAQDGQTWKDRSHDLTFSHLHTLTHTPWDTHIMAHRHWLVNFSQSIPSPTHPYARWTTTNNNSASTAQLLQEVVTAKHPKQNTCVSFGD